MSHGKKWLALVSLLIITAGSGNGVAQENSAIILAARGDISVVANGNSRPVKQGEIINEQEEVVAASRSFAMLQLFDGAKISLRPNSSMTIERFSYGSGEDAVTLVVSQGGIKIVAGAIINERPERFLIRTPTTLLSPNERESSLSLCGTELCESRGLIEITE
jgi:hypothetical protein